MSIRLYVLIHPDHWSLFLTQTPATRKDSAFILAGVFANEELARSAIGALGLLLMETATRNPTAAMRDIVIEAVDIFMRRRAA